MSDTHTKELHEEPRTPSPGEQLKRQREKLGVSLDEAADALHLRPAVIEGLEQDNYEEIPIATYRRGYLRAYAKYLAIDETPILEAYRERHGSLEAERSITPVSVAKPPSRLGAFFFKLVTLLIIAALIAVTVMWWQSRGGSAPPGLEDGQTQRTTPPELNSVEDTGALESDAVDAEAQDDASAPTETASAEPRTSEPSDPAPAVETPDTTPETALNAPPDDAVSLTQPPAIEPAPSLINDTEEDVAEGPRETVAREDERSDANEQSEERAAVAPDTVANTLELTFNEQSWTEIFDANNQRVFVGLQEPGTSASVEGEPPFRLTIGNATGVELRYQGDTIDLEQRAGANNVARFTLGE
ncbi:DUF4115 domain-containing protein [Halomonas alkaliantarctica]|nr:DUF4115 domain-containing protein [Halomonas alkaliantarctica]